ncbi:hypothetical protein [Streptomyces sp. NPDC053048]|uniref:hypothetical protein n=1 Tax=Streptomyces sp. NPDC053048 TaxID=3365694 RepID=UPI0037D7AA6F
MTILPVRDAELLLDEYHVGAWTPTDAERELAESLAFSSLSPSSLRAGLRHAPPGRLSDVLAPVTTVMETTAEIPSAELLPLRKLLDALAPLP